jgi:hypothetical protein
MLFQYWMYYFLFIKKIYKKRHKRTNLAAFNLSVACISFILLFLFVSLEILLDFKGILYLSGQHIPLAPIGIFVGAILLIPIFLLFNMQSGEAKYKIFRKAIIKISYINIVLPVVYITICCLLFIIGLIMVVIHTLK